MCTVFKPILQGGEGKHRKKGRGLLARPPAATGCAGNHMPGAPLPGRLLPWTEEEAGRRPASAAACSRCSSPPAHWPGTALSEHQQHTLGYASSQFSPGAAENPAISRWSPCSRSSRLRRLPLTAGGATYWPLVGSATRSNGRGVLPHPSAPGGGSAVCRQRRGALLATRPCSAASGGPVSVAPAGGRGGSPGGGGWPWLSN